MHRPRGPHHGAPRRSQPVIIDDGVDRCYYYGDGAAPSYASAPQYSDDQSNWEECTDPSGLHLIPTTSSYSHPPPRRGGEISQYNPTYNYAQSDLDGYSTDSRIQIRSSYPPPPPPPPPLRDVILTEVAIGVARIIPVLVTVGVAKAIQVSNRLRRETETGVRASVESTNGQENQSPQGVRRPGVDISEMRKKIDMEVRKIPGLTGGEIIKVDCQIAKSEYLMDLFFSMNAEGKKDLVRALINGDYV